MINTDDIDATHQRLKQTLDDIMDSPTTTGRGCVFGTSQFGRMGINAIRSSRQQQQRPSVEEGEVLKKNVHIPDVTSHKQETSGDYLSTPVNLDSPPLTPTVEIRATLEETTTSSTMTTVTDSHILRVSPFRTVVKGPIIFGQKPSSLSSTSTVTSMDVSDASESTTSTIVTPHPTPSPVEEASDQDMNMLSEKFRELTTDEPLFKVLSTPSPTRTKMLNLLEAQFPVYHQRIFDDLGYCQVLEADLYQLANRGQTEYEENYESWEIIKARISELYNSESVISLQIESAEKRLEIVNQKIHNLEYPFTILNANGIRASSDDLLLNSSTDSSIPVPSGVRVDSPHLALQYPTTTTQSLALTSPPPRVSSSPSSLPCNLLLEDDQLMAEIQTNKYAMKTLDHHQERERLLSQLKWVEHQMRSVSSQHQVKLGTLWEEKRLLEKQIRAARNQAQFEAITLKKKEKRIAQKNNSFQNSSKESFMELMRTFYRHRNSLAVVLGCSSATISSVCEEHCPDLLRDPVVISKRTKNLITKIKSGKKCLIDVTRNILIGCSRFMYTNLPSFYAVMNGMQADDPDSDYDKDQKKLYEDGDQSVIDYLSSVVLRSEFMTFSEVLTLAVKCQEIEKLKRDFEQSAVQFNVPPMPEVLTIEPSEDDEEVIMSSPLRNSAFSLKVHPSPLVRSREAINSEASYDILDNGGNMSGAEPAVDDSSLLPRATKFQRVNNPPGAGECTRKPISPPSSPTSTLSTSGDNSSGGDVSSTSVFSAQQTSPTIGSPVRTFNTSFVRSPARLPLSHPRSPPAVTTTATSSHMVLSVESTEDEQPIEVTRLSDALGSLNLITPLSVSGMDSETEPEDPMPLRGTGTGRGRGGRRRKAGTARANPTPKRTLSAQDKAVLIDSLATHVATLKQQVKRVRTAYLREERTFNPRKITDIAPMKEFRDKYGLVVTEMDDWVSNGDNFEFLIKEMVNTGFGAPSTISQSDSGITNINVFEAPFLSKFPVTQVFPTDGAPTDNSCLIFDLKVQTDVKKGADHELLRNREITGGITILPDIVRASFESRAQSSGVGSFTGHTPALYEFCDTSKKSLLGKACDYALPGKFHWTNSEGVTLNSNCYSGVNGNGVNLIEGLTLELPQGTRAKNSGLSFKHSSAELIVAYIEDYQTCLNFQRVSRRILMKFHSAFVEFVKLKHKIDISDPEAEARFKEDEVLFKESLLNAASGITDVEFNELSQLTYYMRQRRALQVLQKMQDRRNVAVDGDVTDQTLLVSPFAFLNDGSDSERLEFGEFAHDYLVYLRKFTPTALNPMQGESNHSLVRKEFVENIKKLYCQWLKRTNTSSPATSSTSSSAASSSKSTNTTNNTDGTAKEKTTRVRNKEEKNKKTRKTSPAGACISDQKGDVHNGWVVNDETPDLAYHPLSHGPPAWVIRACAKFPWIISTGLLDDCIFGTTEQTGLLSKLQSNGNEECRSVCNAILESEASKIHLLCEAQGFVLSHTSNTYASNKIRDVETPLLDPFMSEGQRINNATSTTSTTHAPSNVAPVRAGNNNGNMTQIIDDDRTASLGSSRGKTRGGGRGRGSKSGASTQRSRSYSTPAPKKTGTTGNARGGTKVTSRGGGNSGNSGNTASKQTPVWNNYHGYAVEGKDFRTPQPQGVSVAENPAVFPMNYFENGRMYASSPAAQVDDYPDGDYAESVHDPKKAKNTCKQVLPIKPSLSFLCRVTGMPLNVDGLWVDPFSDATNLQSCLDFHAQNPCTCGNNVGTMFLKAKPPVSKCCEKCQSLMRPTYTSWGAMIGGTSICAVLGLTEPDIMENIMKCYNILLKLKCNDEQTPKTWSSPEEIQLHANRAYEHLSRIIGSLPRTSIRVPSKYLCVINADIPTGVLRTTIPEGAVELPGCDTITTAQGVTNSVCTTPWEDTGLPTFVMPIFFTPLAVAKKHGLIDESASGGIRTSAILHTGNNGIPVATGQQDPLTGNPVFNCLNAFRCVESPFKHVISGGLSPSDTLNNQYEYVDVSRKPPCGFNLPTPQQQQSPVADNLEMRGLNKLQSLSEMSSKFPHMFGNRSFGAMDVNVVSFAGVSLAKRLNRKPVSDPTGKVSALYGCLQMSLQTYKSKVITPSQDMTVIKKVPYMGTYHSPCSRAVIAANLACGIVMRNDTTTVATPAAQVVPGNPLKHLASDVWGPLYHTSTTEQVHAAWEALEDLRAGGNFLRYYSSLDGNSDKIRELYKSEKARLRQALDILNHATPRIFGTRFDSSYPPRNYVVDENVHTIHKPWVMMDYSVMQLAPVFEGGPAQHMVYTTLDTNVDENAFYFNQPNLWNIRVGSHVPNPYYFAARHFFQSSCMVQHPLVTSSTSSWKSCLNAHLAPLLESNLISREALSTEVYDNGSIFGELFRQYYTKGGNLTIPLGPNAPVGITTELYQPNLPSAASTVHSFLIQHPDPMTDLNFNVKLNDLARKLYLDCVNPQSYAGYLALNIATPNVAIPSDGLFLSKLAEAILDILSTSYRAGTGIPVPDEDLWALCFVKLHFNMLFAKQNTGQILKNEVIKNLGLMCGCNSTDLTTDISNIQFLVNETNLPVNKINRKLTLAAEFDQVALNYRAQQNQQALWTQQQLQLQQQAALEAQQQQAALEAQQRQQQQLGYNFYNPAETATLYNMGDGQNFFDDMVPTFHPGNENLPIFEDVDNGFF